MSPYRPYVPLCGLMSPYAAFVVVHPNLCQPALGRQRFNVRGAWNAVTRELIAVTNNTTVVNTETMCELMRKIAALGLTGSITLVLENARYQRNAMVQALASQLGITLLYLPSYSPNLNLIERLCKFVKRRALYGRYHPTFRDFQGAIQQKLDGLLTLHAEQLKTLNDSQVPDIRRCLTVGSLRYNDRGTGPLVPWAGTRTRRTSPRSRTRSLRRSTRGCRPCWETLRTGSSSTTRSWS